MIQIVAERVADAGSILFITGAGMSADSGIPTYRGVGGLYDVQSTEDGLPIEELLSGAMLERRPELTWKYLLQIADACREATFNRGHEVIAQMEQRVPRVWVLTQNVDGFHRAAGSQNVIDIHGDLHDLVCPTCDWTEYRETLGNQTVPPHCPNCNSIIRPDVVLFGEMLPQEKVNLLRTQVAEGFDLVISVGTSAVFPYITAPIYDARDRGALTVEINPGRSEISGIVEIQLASKAAATLDALWQAV